MKKRDFLKILGIAPAVAVVPALAKANKTNYEYVAEAGRLMDAADISNNALGMMGSKGNNSFDPDITKKFAEAFLEGFEKSRALNKK